MLSNLERQILDNIVNKIRLDANLCADENFADYLRKLAVPLSYLADPTFIYDRRERQVQLETARSLSK